MNVLSLFDGISCGQVALERAQIQVENYYASEIDKHAIRVTQSNYPKTIQLGSVTDIKSADLPTIDLLMGGSPCQGFSFAGKQLNFEDPRSKLFFEYIRLKNELNPKWFLLENVNMKKEYRDVITEQMSVEPVRINSAHFSAQSRDRWYWTNIPISDLPQNLTGVHSILERQVDSKYFVTPENTKTICDLEVQKGKIDKTSNGYKINSIDTILGESSPICPVITPQRVQKRQKGPRFRTSNKSFTLTAQDIHGILKDGQIRRLTPIECERLQTLPDNYTQGSDSQRYKMIGNGWTVDLIAHILKGIT